MAKSESNKAELGSAFDLLFKSWEWVKNNWQMFALVNIAAVLSAIFALFQSKEDDKNYQFFGTGPLPGAEYSAGWNIDLGWPFAVVIVVTLVLAFVLLFLNAMSTRLELLASEQKRPKLEELTAAGKKYWLRLFLLGIISAVIIILGLVLLIVPGLIAIGRLILAPYAMVDKNLGVMDSIRESNRLATGRAMAVWSALGVMLLVILAASLLSNIPAIGTLLSVFIAIVFSLVIPMRYLQIKKIAPARQTNG